MPGYLMAAGVKFPVTEIRLEKAMIVIVAACRGPLPAEQDAIATLFGDDDTGICQMPAPVSWPKIRRGATLTLVQPAQVDSAVWDPGVQVAP